MEDLRAWVVHVLLGAFVALLLADLVDDLLLGNRWVGPPHELFGIVGAIVAGLFAAQLRGRNGKGKNGGNE